MNDLDRDAGSNPRRLSVVQEAKEKIEKTIAYMEAHLHKSITREALAAVAGLNPEHYSRMFRKYMGMSPVDYVTKLRMQQAQSLLRHSNKSIIEIAHLVGYVDPYYFSRRFKQMIGVAPTFYMNRPQQRILALDCYGHCRALGIEPIGADSRDISGYFTDWTGQTEDIGIEAEPYFVIDQLKSLQPDIIITSRKEWEKQLSEFASALVVGVYEDPIYEQLLSIAKGLDKEREALDWVRRYEEQAEVLREKVTERIGGQTVAILRVRDGLLQMYGTMNMGYPIYSSLKLTPPEKMAWQSRCNDHHHSSVITVEELSYYEADHVFVVLQPDSGAELLWEEIQSSKEWLAFPAVRNGAVYHVDVKRWLAYDPVSIKEQMIEAANFLLG
ncbi:AraC family transcriptional regulator [Paenibacillus eucommiae]|uniref:AraC-like DNA-binding protein n=1 Tax=Paenibacillus eucommiae TaxID=1355755 RepID=A0ABS4J0J6_9BACL|nr:AraC family transcriptional regulator [Paenibacillus eucommiae]MBP1993364.1 AraC-like DNA-binding protein [Paenibacillus eucommiae]